MDNTDKYCRHCLTIDSGSAVDEELARCLQLYMTLPLQAQDREAFCTGLLHVPHTLMLIPSLFSSSLRWDHRRQLSVQCRQ